MEKVLLPSYFKINNISVTQESPLLFNLSLGKSHFDGITLEVPDYVLFLLSIADGSKSSDEVFQETMQHFSVEKEELSETFNELVQEKILVDATLHPSSLPKRKDRYARHQLFFESIGVNGIEAQKKINNSRVALIGAGGIGTWLSYNLSAAGVGQLTLIDGDKVELSNLTRQVLFTLDDIGEYKTVAAKKRILERNPDIYVKSITQHITHPADLEDYIGDVDLIILSGDSPSNINELVNDYSFKKGIPWTRAGYHYYTGVVGPMYIPGETSCFECATDTGKISFEELPFVKDINSRFQIPSFSPVNGMAATVATKEALCFLAGINSWIQTTSQMFAFDTQTLESDVIDISTTKRCSKCQEENQDELH